MGSVVASIPWTAALPTGFLQCPSAMNQRGQPRENTLWHCSGEQSRLQKAFSQLQVGFQSCLQGGGSLECDFPHMFSCRCKKLGITLETETGVSSSLCQQDPFCVAEQCQNTPITSLGAVSNYVNV